MVKISVQKAAEAMGGRVVGDASAEISAVSTDTRALKGGELFFALKGENFDAHSFLENAYNGGAACCVISDESFLQPGRTAIVAEDTLKGLQLLAKAYIAERKPLLKVGITGSTGKTSTKELLYACLKGKYNTARNKGNLNNHIGMPLTALSVEAEHQAAIFEMGMGNFGEVDLLADIGRPDMAILTNIGVSHISELGSRENILKAKLEITGYFNEASKLIVNFDNDLIAAYPWDKEKYRVIKVGTDASCDYVIKSIVPEGEDGVDLTLEINGKAMSFKVPNPGAHQGYNAALAVAAAIEAGVDAELIQETIKTTEHTSKRLIIRQSPGGLTVIDDSYNASPDSMKAGIDVLMSMTSKRKILFAADMLGMGEDTEKYHREVGAYAAETGVDLVYTVGKDAAFISDEAAKLIGSEKTAHFETKEALLQVIDTLTEPGDAVLVKASRALEMEKIAEYLLKNR